MLHVAGRSSTREQPGEQPWYTCCYIVADQVSENAELGEGSWDKEFRGYRYVVGTSIRVFIVFWGP